MKIRWDHGVPVLIFPWPRAARHNVSRHAALTCAAIAATPTHELLIGRNSEQTNVCSRDRTHIRTLHARAGSLRDSRPCRSAAWRSLRLFYAFVLRALATTRTGPSHFRDCARGRHEIPFRRLWAVCGQAARRRDSVVPGRTSRPACCRRTSPRAQCAWCRRLDSDASA